jgi:hypothetical protein
MWKRGETIFGRLGFTQRLAFLDLGCSHGKRPSPQALSGGNVPGFDVASDRVAAGNLWDREAGFERTRFREGDASNSRKRHSDSFEVVGSHCRAVIAPDFRKGRSAAGGVRRVQNCQPRLVVAAPAAGCTATGPRMIR